MASVKMGFRMILKVLGKAPVDEVSSRVVF
jgi:hypothetical protein